MCGWWSEPCGRTGSSDGVSSAVSKTVITSVSWAAASRSRLPASSCQAAIWSSPVLTGFCRGGARSMSATRAPYLLEIADADKHAELVKEYGSEV